MRKAPIGKEFRNNFCFAYTALTRAQEKVVVVGSVRGVMKAMTADRNAERMTLLAHRLQETDALAKAV